MVVMTRARMSFTDSPWPNIEVFRSRLRIEEVYLRVLKQVNWFNAAVGKGEEIYRDELKNFFVSICN
jgi:hypothetical protein